MSESTGLENSVSSVPESRRSRRALRITALFAGPATGQNTSIDGTALHAGSSRHARRPHTRAVRCVRHAMRGAIGGDTGAETVVEPDPPRRSSPGTDPSARLAMTAGIGPGTCAECVEGPTSLLRGHPTSVHSAVRATPGRGDADLPYLQEMQRRVPPRTNRRDLTRQTAHIWFLPKRGSGRSNALRFSDGGHPPASR